MSSCWERAAPASPPSPGPVCHWPSHSDSWMPAYSAVWSPLECGPSLLLAGSAVLLGCHEATWGAVERSRSYGSPGAGSIPCGIFVAGFLACFLRAQRLVPVSQLPPWGLVLPAPGSVPEACAAFLGGYFWAAEGSSFKCSGISRG